MSTVTTASHQWATRPDEQRFWTVEEMLDSAERYRNDAMQYAAGDLRADVLGGEVVVNADGLENWVMPSHQGMRSLCRYAGAPIGYLSTLPSELAASCLNVGFAKQEDDVNMLVSGLSTHRSLDAMTSLSYSRIWNDDLIRWTKGVKDAGNWQVPPARPAPTLKNKSLCRPATEKDVLARSKDMGLGVKVGDMIAPAGLYLSDLDMFMVLVNENVNVDDGSDGGLSLGLMVSQAIDGTGKLNITMLGYRHICGNHNFWDVKKSFSIERVHKGSMNLNWTIEANDGVRKMTTNVKDAMARAIMQAMTRYLGAVKQDVLDETRKITGLSAPVIERAYDLADQDWVTTHSANPHTVYGMMQGITRMAGGSDYMSDRTYLDQAAGKLLTVAL